MKINDLIAEVESFMRKWNKYLIEKATIDNYINNKNVGFGEYILINKFENFYSIEILGFQRLTDKPNFVVEVKSNNSDINFFINGGKEIANYSVKEPIIDGSNSTETTSLCSFSDLIVSSLKKDEVPEVLINDVAVFTSGLFKEETDLPFKFNNNSTNVFLNNIAVISKTNNEYSFRKHATTMIIRKNIGVNHFRLYLNRIFSQIDLVPGRIPSGIKLKTQIISELKSLAYHKTDETAIDKFIQLISDDFANALGYKSCKSNVRLKIQNPNKNDTDRKFLSPDFMMEKHDGTYDILDLKLGLLNAKFAFGDWTNSYFSSYAQKLLGQLKGYERYFSDKLNSEWAKNELGIVINKPKLIGIAGNHNNFDREKVDRALEGNINQFNLISYNELAKLLEGK